MNRVVVAARVVLITAGFLLSVVGLVGQTPDQRVAVEFKGRVVDDRMTFEFREKSMKAGFERGVLKDGYYPLLNLDMYFRGLTVKRPLNLPRGDQLAPQVVVDFPRSYIEWATKGKVTSAKSLAFWDPESKSWRTIQELVRNSDGSTSIPSEAGTFRFRVHVWPVDDYIVACF